MVVSYLDTRFAAARARVATMLATSIDGGGTFGPQTFANTAMTAFDQSTGQNVVLGPIPDNNSGGNNMTGKDGTFGFGDRNGLAVLNGRIYPAWSSNRNGGNAGDQLLRVSVGQARFAAGPRIINGTMGPVGLPNAALNTTRAADGTPIASEFDVEFDRRIDRSTFTAADVQVQFRDVNGNASPVAVQSVTALDNNRIGATRFRVQFTPSSQVGTYSYTVGPDVSDRYRGILTDVNPVGGRRASAPSPPVVNLASPDLQTVTSSFVVAGVPGGQVVNDVTVNLSLTHTFDSDLIITLIGPDGTRVLLSNRRGFDGENFINTTFSDTAGTPIANGIAPFTGTFVPDSSLAQLKGRAINGTWRLEVSDVAFLDSGNLINWSISVQPGVFVTTQVSGNQMDQDADGLTNESTDFFAAPRSTSGFRFAAPFDVNTLPLIVPGPRVVSSAIPGHPATLDNLVLNGTVSAIDVTFDRDMNPATLESNGRDVLRVQGPAGRINGPYTVTQINARTYRIGFPTQQLSGTYTVSLGPEIRSASGDAMDADLDAGLDVLRGTSTAPPVQVASSSNTVVALEPGKTVSSQIVITDDFPLQSLTLQLNITHSRVPDLTAELVGPDGTVITLFSGVGSTGTQANFNGTIFDDAANTPIVNGGPPFFGRFRPQQPLGVLNGASSIRGPGNTGNGVYRLQITNNGSVNGNLTGWSIQLGKPVSGTGLGELVADRTPLDFRIFTMDPTVVWRSIPRTRRETRSTSRGPLAASGRPTTS
jgi:subtilisin-like proprotein convertase family protein